MSTSFERRVDARFVLSVIACGIVSFSGVVVETAMNITFPTLMVEFGVDTATVQWITTSYLLVLAAIMPLSALLKRRFRTKRLFVAAIVLFTAGWASVQVIGLLVAFIVLAGAYCVLSRRSSAPLVRIEIFANRRFALSVCYIALFQAIVLGLGYLIPYYAQVVGGLNGFSAGCLLLPGCLIGVFAGKAKGER